MNLFKDYVSTFDLVYLFINVIFIIKCTKNGFVLSILSASKWLLSYIITLLIFPKVRPYINFLDNEFILDIILGISIFAIVIFIILLSIRSIGKAIKYTGIGGVDRFFGFLFGFVKSYVIVVCIFTAINIIYNYERWAINVDESITFERVEKGSNYLIKEFPSQKEHENAKEKIEDI